MNDNINDINELEDTHLELSTDIPTGNDEHTPESLDMIECI